MFDVRFLKNPYYVPELKEQTGLSDAVYDYVFSDPNAEVFIGKLRDLLAFTLPLYLAEGKTSLVSAGGCTGGRHRSVSVSRRRVEPTITVSSTVSRVVPGISVTITRSQPARAFKRRDFPTLGRPTMAAETPCRKIRPWP